MRRFLRVVKADNSPEYINLDRVERIEIQEGVLHALVFLIGKTEPIVVKDEHYSNLIDFLGKDMEAD